MTILVVCAFGVLYIGTQTSHRTPCSSGRRNGSRSTSWPPMNWFPRSAFWLWQRTSRIARRSVELPLRLGVVHASSAENPVKRRSQKLSWTDRNQVGLRPPALWQRVRTLFFCHGSSVSSTYGSWSNTCCVSSRLRPCMTSTWRLPATSYGDAALLLLFRRPRDCDPDGDDVAAVVPPVTAALACGDRWSSHPHTSASYTRSSTTRNDGPRRPNRTRSPCASLARSLSRWPMRTPLTKVPLAEPLSWMWYSIPACTSCVTVPRAWSRLTAASLSWRSAFSARPMAKVQAGTAGSVKKKGRMPVAWPRVSVVPSSSAACSAKSEPILSSSRIVWTTMLIAVPPFGLSEPNSAHP